MAASIRNSFRTGYRKEVATRCPTSRSRFDPYRYCQIHLGVYNRSYAHRHPNRRASIRRNPTARCVPLLPLVPNEDPPNEHFTLGSICDYCARRIVAHDLIPLLHAAAPIVAAEDAMRFRCAKACEKIAEQSHRIGSPSGQACLCKEAVLSLRSEEE